MRATGTQGGDMARHELWGGVADRPGNLAALAGDLAACRRQHRPPRRPGRNRRHGDRPARRPGPRPAQRRAGGGGPALRRHPAPARQDSDEPQPPPPQGPVIVRRLLLRPHRRARPSGSPVADDPRAPRGPARRGAGPPPAPQHQRPQRTRRPPRTLLPRSRGGTADCLLPGVDVDDDGLVALAALVGGAIVGAARYELRDGGKRADVSVIVEGRASAPGHRRPAGERAVATLRVEHRGRARAGGHPHERRRAGPHAPARRASTSPSAAMATRSCSTASSPTTCRRAPDASFIDLSRRIAREV